MRRHRERKHIVALISFLLDLGEDVEQIGERWAYWCEARLPHDTVLGHWLMEPAAGVLLLGIYLAAAPFLLLAGLLQNVLRFL